MNIPQELFYATTHEWVKKESPSIVTIGITDHAQAELSDIVYVELPQLGGLLSAGQAVAVVESVKAASDIYTPVSGKVIKINHDLEGNPSLINTAPFNEGWMFQLEISEPAELNQLLSAEEYSQTEEDLGKRI